jgi:hypothetical protein
MFSRWTGFIHSTSESRVSISTNYFVYPVKVRKWARSRQRQRPKTRVKKFEGRGRSRLEK